MVSIAKYNLSRGELIRRREAILTRIRYKFTEIDLIEKMDWTEFSEYKNICKLLSLRGENAPQIKG